MAVNIKSKMTSKNGQTSYLYNKKKLIQIDNNKKTL